MSVLVIQIPPRKRLGPRASGPDDASASAPSSRAEYHWVSSLDGRSIATQGRSAPTLLPRAESVVAVVGECDVGWQRVKMPKAPAAKLRAALGSLVEEAVLDEPDALQLAIAADAVAGAPTWVAVVDRAWLEGEIRALERGGTLVDRVVPSLWPGDVPQGHFIDVATDGATPEPAIAMADANGIVCVPLAGTLARALLPQAAALATRWTAPPAVAAAAERWLGAPVAVQTAAERLLVAARTSWNLRQFELAPRRRGTRALREAGKRFLSPGWRPVRLGLVALAVLQVVGLNAWAWSQRRAIEHKRAAQIALLREAHPQVRSVIDAPLQMERENDRLRTLAGRPGAADLEPMLAAAAAAWPQAQGPAQSLRFQPGQLSLATSGWSESDVKQFGDRLRPGGWAIEPAPGRVTITRSGAPASTRSPG
jgi:general secretion pathway protein L